MQGREVSFNIMRLIQTVVTDVQNHVLFLGTVKYPLVWFKTMSVLLGCAFFVQQIPSVSVKSVS